MAAQVPSRLYRSRSQKMIAGVCGGLGEYFDVDPVLIRLLFVVTTFISGVGILAYIVLWIVVPFEGDDGPRMEALRRDFDDLSGRVREYVDPERGRPRGGTGHHAAAPGADDAVSTVETRTTTTTTAAVGETSPAAAPTTTAADADGEPLRRTVTHVAHEEAFMTGESVTTSRLPARYDPATTAIDPFGEPLPEGPPRISSSTPGATATADAPNDALDAPVKDGATRNPSTHHAPPFGSSSFAVAGAASAPPERRRRRQHWAGAILIILGLLILGNNLGLLWWVEPEYILPLILVCAGAWLLFGRGRRG
jgi:phage shock protein C